MNPEQFNNLSPDDKKAMGIPTESGEAKLEQPFFKKGLVNRNFGKDAEKPTEALFYKGGVLNRAKFHESFGRIYNKIMNPGRPEATPTSEAGATEQIGGESAEDQQKVDQAMTDLFDVFKNDKDPETAAFNYISTHLDSSLTTEQQLDKLREFKNEYNKIKQQINQPEMDNLETGAIKETEMTEREKGYFYTYLQELMLTKQFGAEAAQQFEEQDAEWDEAGSPEEKMDRIAKGKTDAAFLFPTVKKFATQLEQDWNRNKQNPWEFAQGLGVSKEEFIGLYHKAQEFIKELESARKRRHPSRN